MATDTTLGYGLGRLASGLAFSLGLIMLVFAGGELFTGNNLMVLAFAGRKVSSRALLRNWGIAYLANAAGALLLAFAIHLSGIADNAAVKATAIRIAEAKVQLGVAPAFLRGVTRRSAATFAVGSESLQASLRQGGPRQVAALRQGQSGWLHSDFSPVQGPLLLRLLRHNPCTVSGADSRKIRRSTAKTKAAGEERGMPPQVPFATNAKDWSLHGATTARLMAIKSRTKFTPKRRRGRQPRAGERATLPVAIPSRERPPVGTPSGAH